MEAKNIFLESQLSNINPLIMVYQTPCYADGYTQSRLSDEGEREGERKNERERESGKEEER